MEWKITVHMLHRGPVCAAVSDGACNSDTNISILNPYNARYFHALHSFQLTCRIPVLAYINKPSAKQCGS